MKKKIVYTFIALLITVLVAAPYLVGIKISKQYNASLAHINAHLAPDIKLVGTFKNGYLSSSATTQVNTVNGLTLFSLVHTIKHGPFIPGHKIFKMAAVNTVIDGNVNTVINNVYNNKEAYAINSEFDFSGIGETIIKNNPVTIDNANFKINWQGMNLVIKNQKNFAAIDAQLSMPLLNVIDNASDKKNEVSVVELKSTFAVAADTTNNHSASANLDVSQVKISAAAAEVVNLQKANLTTNSKLVNKLVSSEIIYKFDKMVLFVTDVYGPLLFNIKLNNLNAVAFEKLSAKQQENAMPYPELLADILSTQPTVDIVFNLGLPNGKIELNARMQSSAVDVKQLDPKTIMNNVAVTLSLKITQATLYEFLAKYAENEIHRLETDYFAKHEQSTIKNPFTISPKDLASTIQAWVTSAVNILKTEKILQENKDMLSIDIKLTNNIVTVNGAEIKDADMQRINNLLMITDKTIINTEVSAVDTNKPVEHVNKIQIVPPLVAPKDGGNKNTAPSQKKAGGGGKGKKSK